MVTVCPESWLDTLQRQDINNETLGPKHRIMRMLCLRDCSMKWTFTSINGLPPQKSALLTDRNPKLKTLRQLDWAGDWTHHADTKTTTWLKDWSQEMINHQQRGGINHLKKPDAKNLTLRATGVSTVTGQRPTRLWRGTGSWAGLL